MFYTKNSYYNVKKSGKNDSKFEAGVAQRLELEKKGKLIKDFKEQVSIPLIVNNYVVCTYRIDFVIEHNDGTTEYLEAKGFATPMWKIKYKLFEALYGDLPKVKLTVEYQGRSWKPQRRRIKQ